MSMFHGEAWRGTPARGPESAPRRSALPRNSPLTGYVQAFAESLSPSTEAGQLLSALPPPQRAAMVGLSGEGSSRFRFQAGSYGGPRGYLPSIACLKREATGDWVYHFVLVVPDDVREDEEGASLQAGEHLFTAFEDGSSPETVANALRAVGYMRVSDFHVVADDPSGERRFVPAMDPGE